MNKKTNKEGRLVLAAAFLLGGLLVSTQALAETPAFNSGSTGADGALDLTGTPSGTAVTFDPAARGVDPEGDNIFHFTTITIPSGVSLVLSTKKMPNKPVLFLAQGAVTINGWIYLDGENGYQWTLSGSVRRPSYPGPGGFPGGVGGNKDGSFAAQPGAGPYGGPASPCPAHGDQGCGASASGGNKYLVPLTGGSGGGGGRASSYGWWGAGGGAGGGALLIASSASILVSGGISANGGYGGGGTSNQCADGTGGGGGGGGIRLVAPLIQGGGKLNANGGYNPCNRCDGTFGYVCAASGRVRLEAYQQNWGFSISAGSYTTGTPVSSYIPSTPPAISVVSVGGIPIAANPTGEFTPPDAVINSINPVTLQIRARGIAVGTIPKVQIYSLEGPDLLIDATPLTGSLQDSSATATVTFPAGYSRGYVRAKW